ncbi:MAG: O-antigen ligase family protein [Steroidobacteraceae bacterium]|nr:O-antigen ligase family protein [Steroidobacteraceae bacterium]
MNARSSRATHLARRTGTATIPKNVYLLLGTFLVLEYTRIPSIIPVLGVLRLQFLLTLLIAVAWFRYADRNDLRHPIVRWVLAFTFLCGLSVFYTPNTRAAFNMTVNIFLYLVAVILPLLAFVRTTDRLKWFLGLFTGSCVFISLWALTHAGMGPGGFITDENDCALVLNVALPFAVALAGWPAQTARARLFWMGGACLLVLGTVATMSRGGFLGLVACAAVMFWYARRKMRVIGIALVSLLIVVPVAPLVLPARYMDEIRSIGDPNDGTRQNRLYFWKLGWMMYKANPVLGVGAGNYPWTVSDYEKQLPPDQLFQNRYSGGRPSHSLYFTLLPELGTAGVIVFASLVYLVIQTGRRVQFRPPRSRAKSVRSRAPSATADEPIPAEQLAIDRVGRAVITSCVAFLATGAFISVLYYPSFWHLCGIAASLGTIALRHRQATTPQAQAAQPGAAARIPST